MGYCDWGFTFDALKTYHDSEWGVPIHDDRVMFEHLMMEVLHTEKKKDFPYLL